MWRCRARMPKVLVSFLKFLMADCSCAGCKRSPRDRAILKEMNESVFALNFTVLVFLSRAKW